MMWNVRAVIDDRPGTMAAFAARCGQRAVNILGLQIAPAVDGRIVDELVLQTPGGWTGDDVVRLCALAGVVDAAVTPCWTHALEDQPVDLGAARMSSTDPDGPLASEAPPDHQVAPVHPVPQGSPVLRTGSTEDAEALIAMHARCSAETVYRRYHSAVPNLTPRMARALLGPPAGASMLLTAGPDVVAAGMFCAANAEEPGQAELGLMVEDAWQRRGEGARLLRALAVEAADRGVENLTCVVQPDNEAVLRTIQRARLRGRVTYADGLVRYRIPLSGLRASPEESGRRRSNRPLMGAVTCGLVPLLHERRELRDAHPAADLIDQAVRGGA